MILSFDLVWFELFQFDYKLLALNVFFVARFLSSGYCKLCQSFFFFRFFILLKAVNLQSTMFILILKIEN